MKSHVKEILIAEQLQSDNFLNQWVAGRASNSTLIFAVTGHLDVSAISPGCSPRVLDDPIITFLVGTIANSQNTMIQFFAAASWFNINT